MGARKGFQSGLEYSPAGSLAKIDKSKEVRHITKTAVCFPKCTTKTSIDL